ncbi:hypothetical protein FKW77_009535 [Venturia effusa]|uniref:Uncharacterized protein n=1 Tax=Venturia effusa TaxID=50376 RepID=A0A517L206_9PEZI|nr:hypothetical protein FKW77_009535 [Venturia effusa]
MSVICSQAPKRKLDSVDASATTNACKRKKLVPSKLSSSISDKPTSSESSSQAAPQPQPKPCAWGQGGKTGASLFDTTSKASAKPPVAVIPVKTGPQVAPPANAPVAWAKTSPIKVARINLPAKGLKTASGNVQPQQVQPQSSVSAAISGSQCSASLATLPPKPAPASLPARGPTVGQICWLPHQSAVAAGEPIHQHPDFKNNSRAFGHPCLVTEGPDAKGYLTCFQSTSFGQAGGLMTKYADKGSKSMAGQRNRWLLIDCNGKTANHDNQPLLSYEPHFSGRMQKTTYVNCEKWFKIRPCDLTTKGPVPMLCDDHAKRSPQQPWSHAMNDKDKLNSRQLHSAVPWIQALDSDNRHPNHDT